MKTTVLNKKTYGVLGVLLVLALTLIMGQPAESLAQNALPTASETAELPTTWALLEGCKFIDANGNGIWDTGEPTLPNWPIVISNSSGYFQIVYTNADGCYRAQVFTGSGFVQQNTPYVPYTYNVSEQLWPDWEQTFPPAGSYTVTVYPNQTVKNLDFGNARISDLYRYVYNVKFVCGFSPEDSLWQAQTVQGVYATEINILNSQYGEGELEASIRKYLVLLTDGDQVYREPEYNFRHKRTDYIELPPNAATLDDCQRIAEYWLERGYGSLEEMPLTIGFLQLESNRPLTVDAVYTARALDRHQSLTMEIERIEAQRIRVK